MKRLAQDTTCVVDDPDRDLRPPFVVSLHHPLSQDSECGSFFCGDAKLAAQNHSTTVTPSSHPPSVSLGVRLIQINVLSLIISILCHFGTLEQFTDQTKHRDTIVSCCHYSPHGIKLVHTRASINDVAGFWYQATFPASRGILPHSLLCGLG